MEKQADFDQGKRYQQWLQQHGSSALIFYAFILAVILPGMDGVLRLDPGAHPDLLPWRVGVALLCLALAAMVQRFPGWQRQAYRLQILNTLPALLLTLYSVHQSGERYTYLATGLLVIFGIQHAFFVIWHLAMVYLCGFLGQVGYSWSIGTLGMPLNTITLAIYGGAYIIGLISGGLRIRIQQQELLTRFESESMQRYLQKQLVRERLLASITESIRSTFDTTQIFQNIVRSLGEVTRCDRCEVALWDEIQQAMIFQCDYRRRPEFPPLSGVQFPRQEWMAIYQRLIAAEPVHIPDVSTSIFSEPQKEILATLQTDEFAFVPILNRDNSRLLGLVGLTSCTGPHRLDPTMLDLLTFLAPQVAIAIQQGQLHQQLEGELQRQRTMAEQWVDLAYRDPLTNLYNRRYFIEHLDQVLHAPDPRKGAILYLDLDHFKQVNDTLGHEAGDQLLIQVGQVLDQTIRKSDVLARLGGDEFAILLNAADLEAALVVAEKIWEKIVSHPWVISGISFDIGVSIGIAVLNPALKTEANLAQADAGCYRAKTLGSDQPHLST